MKRAAGGSFDSALYGTLIFGGVMAVLVIVAPVVTVGTWITEGPERSIRRRGGPL